MMGSSIYNNGVPEGDIAKYCTHRLNYMRYTSSANFAISNEPPTDKNKDYWHDFIRGN